MSINSTAAASSTSGVWATVGAATGSPSTATAAATTAATTAATGTDASQSLNQTFLTMLVAQLNNQDPMNPMDSSQMTSQMAQISTVSGISSLNTSITSLLTQFQQLETMQAAQLSGTSVLVPGSSLNLAATSAQSGSGSGVSAQGAVQLASSADAETVQVEDSSGNVVKTINAGSQGTGLQQFTWDGSTDAGGIAAAGTYSFVVKASSGGTAVAATTYSALQVTGSSTDSTGAVQLSLSDGSQVPYGSIKQFL
jgi:flagellar basal-body rod modification protein FlgD